MPPSSSAPSMPLGSATRGTRSATSTDWPVTWPAASAMAPKNSAYCWCEVSRANVTYVERSSSISTAARS